MVGPFFPDSPWLTASPWPIPQSEAAGRSSSAAPGGCAAGAPPSPTPSTSSSSDSDGDSAASAPPSFAAQPSEAQPAAPPPRPPGAPLQVVSAAPSPVANRAAASAIPDALASAEEGLLSRSASLGPATPAVRSAPAPLERHDPDTDDEEGDRAGGDAGSEGLDALCRIRGRGGSSGSCRGRRL